MKYTKEVLEEAVKNSDSVNTVLKYLKIKYAGGFHSHISSQIKKYKIDTSHFIRYKNKGKPAINKLTWQERLVAGRLDRRENAISLRAALIESGREYKCNKCSIKEWNKQVLILQVNHINRDRFDNRPENLEFICPNCHSQLEGTCGRKNPQSITGNYNKEHKKIKCKDCDTLIWNKGTRCRICCQKYKQKNFLKRPSKEQLIKDILELKGFVPISKKYEVSDNAVRKWCKFYGLPTTKIRKFTLTGV